MTTKGLRSLLSYDSTTGDFTWLSNTRRAGLRAGSLARNGYVTIRVQGRLLYAHRLAWVFVVGLIPRGYEIDHIDGARANNRITNLRLATRSENNCNSRKRGKPTPKGVCFDRSRGLFMAYIDTLGQRKYLGRFDSIDAASAAVRAERSAQHGAFANHGERP